ncbi:GNAT family N-acetyltransferase [Exiguobacterium sp. s193]|uniref:GNAT family N-acetyltransferase n=1 Tax=Exiguobacterium sp. s193 TaxID=2751207 RepID=UPI001BE9CBFC|nr:GNAT family N-acetyltransferase [Exiguobacterium sp. s193]
MYHTEFVRFNQLGSLTLYQLLKLRTDIFVVEQNCPYPELDDRDQTAIHALAYADQQLIGCLRVLPRSESRAVAIGRVAVHADFRSHGIARRLMNEAIEHIRRQEETQVYLQAQEHLKAFYASFGFEETSETYLEDGIPHIDMQLVL